MDPYTMVADDAIARVIALQSLAIGASSIQPNHSFYYGALNALGVTALLSLILGFVSLGLFLATLTSNRRLRLVFALGLLLLWGVGVLMFFFAGPLGVFGAVGLVNTFYLTSIVRRLVHDGEQTPI
jgi:hypothetical protein